MPIQEIKLDIIYTCKNGCIGKYTSDRVDGSKTIMIAESNQWSRTLKVNVVRVTMEQQMTEMDDLAKAQIVRMILEKQTERALERLSEFYHVTPPQIVVGTIKRKRRTVYALYIPKERKIYALNSDIFFNPFVVLHEYYHHIRSKLGVHRGSERNANKFAQEFIDAYKKTVGMAGKT